MIVVYLDSCDYSVMADADRHPWAQQIRSELTRLVQNGVIEIRFSSLHPLEGAHTTDEALSMAMRRAEIMQELSGRKCFSWWSDIVAAEAMRIARGVTLNPAEYAFNDDGRWFPALQGLAESMKDVLASAVEQVLVDEKLTRSRRRQMMRRIIKDGALTREALSIIEPNRQQTLDEVRRHYPLPERFFSEDVFFRYASGKVPAKVVVDLLEEGLGDLPFFVGWAYHRHDPDRKLTAWLRTGQLSEVIAEVCGQIDALAERGRQIGVDYKKFNATLKRVASVDKIRRTILERLFERDKKDLYKLGLTKELWATRVVASLPGQIPSLDAMLDVASDYFYRHIAFAPNRRKAKVSDFGDLMHMLHLPYVDIFRADGDSAQMARVVGARLGVTIVGNLQQLPAAIMRVSSVA